MNGAPILIQGKPKGFEVLLERVILFGLKHLLQAAELSHEGFKAVVVAILGCALLLGRSEEGMLRIARSPQVSTDLKDQSAVVEKALSLLKEDLIVSLVVLMRPQLSQNQQKANNKKGP